MTLTLVSSRDTAALSARAAREEAAKAARAILRSAALHSDEAILWACNYLREWGGKATRDDDARLIVDAMVIVLGRVETDMDAISARIDWATIAAFLAAGFAIVMIAVVGWA